MALVKKLLMVIGAVVVVLVAVLIWTARSSSHFKEEQEMFITQFMSDLSKNWSIADVQDRLSNEFLQSRPPVEMDQAIHRLSPLGKLVSIQDVELKLYSAGTTGKTGTFSFKAEYANGHAVASMIVVDTGNGVRVQRLDINPIEPPPGIKPQRDTPS
jgi:hypothetical protein